MISVIAERQVKIEDSNSKLNREEEEIKQYQ
jgi:hypothetical protein